MYSEQDTLSSHALGVLAGETRSMHNDKYLGKLMRRGGKCWGMNKWAMGWGRAFKEGPYEVTMESSPRRQEGILDKDGPGT